MRSGTTITVDGLPVIINVPRGSSAWRKANAVFCPLGPAPMQAWLLMLRSDVASLDANAAHTITWSAVEADDADPPVETTTTLAFPGLYIINAERVLHGGQDDGNAIYLVEFADGRYLAAKKSDSGIIQANIRTHANANDYMLGTQGETWETLTQKLWDRCGTLGTYAGLPAALPIDGVPQNTWLNGLNSYRSLTAVLEQLDCAIQRDPFSAAMNIVQLGADQALPIDSDGFLKWDGQPITSKIADVAANLTIYHYYHFSAYGQERDAEYKNNWAYNDPAGPTAMPTGIVGANGTQPLWDDLPRILDETNVVSNAAAVTTRDTNRVARYAIRWSVTNRHKIFAGLMATAPGGQIRAVLWRNWDDGEDNELGGTVTEWITCSQLITGLKQSSSGFGEWAWLDDELVAPEREPYAAPDISRHSFPNFPRLPNMVQVWQPSDSVSIGDEVSRGYVNNFGYSFFSGRVRRWVSNQLNGTTGDFALDDCWILFTDDITNVGGNVKAMHGEIYGPARLSGVSSCSVPKANGDYDSSAALQRPVYVLRRGTPDVEMVTLSDKNGSGELQLGLLGNGVFVGRIITSKFNGDGLMSKHNFCAIHFADFGLDAEVANLKIIAENGRIYGPAKYVGEANVASYSLTDDNGAAITTLPVYRCSIGVQEFNAVSSSGYSKGAVGTFQLCTQLGTPLNIFIDALCLYNAYTVGADSLNPNLARINRTYNGTVANQTEC